MSPPVCPGLTNRREDVFEHEANVLTPFLLRPEAGPMCATALALAAFFYLKQFARHIYKRYMFMVMVFARRQHIATSVTHVSSNWPQTLPDLPSDVKNWRATLCAPHAPKSNCMISN